MTKTMTNQTDKNQKLIALLDKLHADMTDIFDDIPDSSDYYDVVQGIIRIQDGADHAASNLRRINAQSVN